MTISLTGTSFFSLAVFLTGVIIAFRVSDKKALQR
jgi:hypothetical protein